MVIRTQFYTIKVDSLNEHALDFERIALPIEHELRDRELAQEARIVAQKIRDFCAQLQAKAEKLGKVSA